MNKIDELLYESLTPSHEPSENLNRRIMDRRSNMKQGTMIRKRLATAATFGCVLLAGGTGVYAVSHYLQPSEIASEVSENNALNKAFESKSAININETQKSGTYIITLLGMVTGQDLKLCVSDKEASDLHEERTYVALAISNEDGMPIKNETKTVSPLISGLDWRDATLADMDATLHSFVRNGVLYELLECDNLEIFAGRGVQLGVVDQFGEEANAFEMDKSTGTYQKVRGYMTTNALFTLPLDPSKGDEAAVAAYLNTLEASRKQTNEEIEDISDLNVSSEVNDFVKLISGMSVVDAGKYIQNHCHLAGTVTLPYDENGDFKWGEEYDSDTADVLNGSSGMMNISGYKISVPTYSHMDTDGTPDGTDFAVITVNKNNTVTMEVYSFK